jgi:hypothetical protein
MTSVTELFEQIKHDLASVTKMFALCDEYLSSKETDDDFPYFKGKLTQKIAEYKQSHPVTNIDSLVITGYKNDYKECGNCNESVSNISCYVNNDICVVIDVSWYDKYKTNIYLITISNDSHDQAFKLYSTDIQYISKQPEYYKCELHKCYWLVSKLAATGHTTSEFAVVLQALCA